MSTDTDALETSPDADRPERTPTRASTAIALSASLLVAAALLWQVDRAVVPALVGCAGAVCFAVSLWLVSLDRYETAATLAASLLTVPVAVGLLAGTAGTVLVLVGAFFPVENAAALSIQSLVVVGQVGVVVGCTLAVLGAALGVRNVVDGRTLAAHYWLTIRTGMVPGLVGAVMVASAALTDGTPGTEIVGGLVAWLLAPAAAETHLATLLGLVALTVIGVWTAIDALPVAELLSDRGGGEFERDRLSGLRSALSWTATGATLAFVGALAVELALDPVALERTVGDPVYRSLRSLSTSPALRWLLAAVASLSVFAAVGAGVLRRLARSSTESIAGRSAPYVGGAVVTAAAVALAGPLLAAVVGWTVERLPGLFGETALSAARSAVATWGASTIVVALATGLIGATAALALLLRIAVFAGYLSRKTAGYSLASGGLFAATAFAGGIGAPAWLVFGGVVGSLLVWDTGRYGTTLGEEVGRRAPTRDAELVHAGGTLAVGLLGIGVAYAVTSAMDAGSVGDSPTLIVALLGVLAGIVSLVVALR